MIIQSLYTYNDLTHFSIVSKTKESSRENSFESVENCPITRYENTYFSTKINLLSCISENTINRESFK